MLSQVGASRGPIGPTPSWPAATAEALIRLWNSGLSAAQVAARLGATTRAVESKVRKLRVAGYPLDARRSKPPPRLQRARRKCLYCCQGFASSHVGNRICPTEDEVVRRLERIEDLLHQQLGAAPRD